VRVAGIDVGLNFCKLAVIEDELLYVGDYRMEKLRGVIAAGIDAPLSFPKTGMLRECERKLLKLGIKLFPSGAPFFRSIALRGMEIAEELRKNGIKVYEVYPYATRVLMGIASNSKKRTKRGLLEITREVGKILKVPNLTHDELDAVISALTVREFLSGRGFVLSGEDGEIILPERKDNADSI
jgi:predicted nuclease with RNAse H fold